MLCQEPLRMNVVSQNVLLDYTRTKKKLILPQSDRVDSMAATILNRFESSSLDVVGIQEAQRSKKQHNGEVLADLCGHGKGHWVEHNEKPYEDSPTGRPGEHVGMFGGMVDYVEPIDIGGRRKAVATVIAGTAFITCHLRAGDSLEHREERAEQAQVLTRYAANYDNAVLFGDFNEPHVTLPYLKKFTQARNVIADQGFTSVFKLTGQKPPLTCPIDSYKPLFNETKDWRGKLITRAWALDDILVRGPQVNVLAAGVLDRVIVHEKQHEGVPLEASDHDGLWANITIAP